MRSAFRASLEIIKCSGSINTLDSQLLSQSWSSEDLQPFECLVKSLLLLAGGHARMTVAIATQATRVSGTP